MYGESQAAAAGVGGAHENPYFFPNINLSGKIDSGAAASTTTSGGGLLESVTAAVESGYSSARRVVFGESGGQATSPNLSLFSLSYGQIVNFAACFCVGCLFMFLAFLFLPMVVIAPQKFVLLFTLGSLSWLAGLGTLQGAAALFAAMMQKERLPFSVGYLASLAGTFYATMIAHSYILTIFFAGFQLLSLGAFVISYFPGGIKVLSIVKGVVVDRVMALMGKAPQTILPI